MLYLERFHAWSQGGVEDEVEGIVSVQRNKIDHNELAEEKGAALISYTSSHDRDECLRYRNILTIIMRIATGLFAASMFVGCVSLN